MVDLIDECRKIIEENFRPAGYNNGYNVGAVAGQTVMHCHCHFIPRYPGDTDKPRGENDGLLPEKITMTPEDGRILCPLQGGKIQKSRPRPDKKQLIPVLDIFHNKHPQFR